LARATSRSDASNRRRSPVFSGPLAPHVVAGEWIASRIELWLGKGLEGEFREAQILAGGNFQIERRSFHDRDRLAEPFDELRVVGGGRVAAAGVGVEQQLLAKDLRRLRFPEVIARDRFNNG